MSNRYTNVAIILHWLIALLLIANLTFGLGHDWLKDARGMDILPVHKSIGLTILVLSVLRLMWRLGHRPPPLPAEMGVFTRRLARTVHGLFYVVIIVMPLSGWVMSSAGQRALSWFGLFDVPKFAVEKGSIAAGVSHETHELLAWFIIALIVLHVAAALYHHFLRRDAVLASIMPMVSPRRSGL